MVEPHNDSPHRTYMLKIPLGEGVPSFFIALIGARFTSEPPHTASYHLFSSYYLPCAPLLDVSRYCSPFSSYRYCPLPFTILRGYSSGVSSLKCQRGRRKAISDKNGSTMVMLDLRLCLLLLRQWRLLTSIVRFRSHRVCPLLLM